jgi:glycosyltransferase involved in cell wall biosynthesis
MKSDTRELVFVMWRSSFGGIEVQIPVLANILGEKKVITYVLRKELNEKTDVLKGTGIKTVYGSRNGILLYIRLLVFALKNRDKVFTGFNLGPYIIFILRLACIKRIIYFIHGTKYWKNNFQKVSRKLFWKLSLSNEITFIANSDFSKNIFMQHISKGHDIKVIYNNFDTSSYKPVQRDTDPAKLNIFYIGRLAKGKNLPMWIDIAEKLLKSYPMFRFHIYGEGRLKEDLEGLIKSKNLQDKVFIYGFIRDTASVYQDNDLLMFLSEYESFGNVVVESILCGTPVIASRIPAMEEIFSENKELLIDPNDDPAAEILEKIRNYSALKETALRLSCEFREFYSPDKYNSEIRKLYADA